MTLWQAHPKPSKIHELRKEREMRTNDVARFIEANKQLQNDRPNNHLPLDKTGKKTTNGDEIFMVPIKCIIMDTDALQPRDDPYTRSSAYFASKRHVETLRKPLLNPKLDLEPIIITRVSSSSCGPENKLTNTGECWAVIDGHHRLEAYKTSKNRQLIPAIVFEGSPEDKVLLAIKSNNKDKLAMSSKEKISTAWIMFVVLGDTKGKTKTILDLGVSRGTLQKFREKAKLINKDIASGRLNDKPITDFNWQEALKYPKDLESVKWDKDADEAFIQDVSERLFRAFGHTLKNSDVTLVSQALELHLGEKKFESILEWHQTYSPDDFYEESFESNRDF